MHQIGIVHRDIKLDNILLDGQGNIKIGDFGVSRRVEPEELLFEQCGTPAYLAPEIIMDKGYKGFYVDIWSLGVLLYAMLQGTVPFKADNLEKLHNLIMRGNFKYPVPISNEARELIERMLTIEPESRISIPEILRHKWLKTEDELDCTEEDDDHDFQVGLEFRR